MAIGLNSLILENKNLSSIMDNTIDEECYLYGTISYLNSMNEEFREANKELYRSIYEADSLVAVNESFADFFTKIKDIIIKFLKYLKSLTDRFTTTLHRIVGSKKYIIKNEEELKKFNTDCEFDYDGYTFTIDPNIPVCNALEEFSKEFVRVDFDSIAKETNNKEKKHLIKKVYDSKKNELDNDYYDLFRARVLGRDGQRIYQSEFGNELFQIFRDGSDNTSVFTISSAIINECINSLKSFDTSEKDIKSKKKEMENQYNSILKQIDSMISSNRNNKVYNLDINTGVYDGKTQINLDNDAMNQLNLYVKALMNQITEMTTIHSMAFSYKLDAIKDKYNQDKRILYIALSKIQKDKNIRTGGDM